MSSPFREKPIAVAPVEDFVPDEPIKVDYQKLTPKPLDERLMDWWRESGHNPANLEKGVTRPIHLKQPGESWARKNK